MRQSILLLFFLCFFLTESCVSMNTVSRDITIQVVDSATNTPIPNICIYYGLVAIRYKTRILETHERPIWTFMYEGKTNENGILIIPHIDIPLTEKDVIRDEGIVINVDVNDKAKHIIQETYNIVSHRKDYVAFASMRDYYIYRIACLPLFEKEDYVLLNSRYSGVILSAYKNSVSQFIKNQSNRIEQIECNEKTLKHDCIIIKLDTL